MDTQGRAHAVTVISPVRSYWALWLRISFPLLSRAPQPPLLRLSFIHIAHWSLLQRVPPRGRDREPLPHPYLIFNSNFNGDISAYIDAFALVVPWRMRLIWHGIYGFPGPKVVDRFLSFVVTRATAVQHYYCAYPDASAKIIAGALELKDRHRQLEQANDGDDDAFLARWGRFLEENQQLLAGGGTTSPRPGPTPTSVVVLAPISGSADALAAELDALPEGEQSPFAKLPGTHFGRFAAVPALTGPRDEPLSSAGAFLLMAADFDGTLGDWAAALCKPEAAAALEVMGRWQGFPHSRDAASVAAFLETYAVPPGLTFLGYHATVAQVREALRLRSDLRALAVRAQNDHLDAVAVRRAWQTVVSDVA